MSKGSYPPPSYAGKHTHMYIHMYCVREMFVHTFEKSICRDGGGTLKLACVVQQVFRPIKNTGDTLVTFVDFLFYIFSIPMITSFFPMFWHHIFLNGTLPVSNRVPIFSVLHTFNSSVRFSMFSPFFYLCHIPQRLG